MDATLRKLKKDAITTLGDNLVCLLHHGSRAKGEAYPESDYDVIVIAKEVDEETLKKIRGVFKRHPRFSSYLLSLRDLETLPKAQLLEFIHARPLYGEIELETPETKDVGQYLSYIRREELHRIRHYLVHEHPREKKAKYLYYGLKAVYIYLSFLAFCESGELPRTRKQTIAYFRNKKNYSHGVRLLQILDNWNASKDKAAKNPDRYLFTLERFFRGVSP